jgi:hypothetical protein
MRHTLGTLAQREQIRRTRRRLRARVPMRRKLAERGSDRRIRRAFARLDWSQVPYRSGDDSFGSMLRMAMWMLEE